MQSNKSTYSWTCIRQAWLLFLCVRNTLCRCGLYPLSWRFPHTLTLSCPKNPKGLGARGKGVVCSPWACLQVTQWSAMVVVNKCWGWYWKLGLALYVSIHVGHNHMQSPSRRPSWQQLQTQARPFANISPQPFTFCGCITGGTVMLIHDSCSTRSFTIFIKSTLEFQLHRHFVLTTTCANPTILIALHGPLRYTQCQKCLFDMWYIAITPLCAHKHVFALPKDNISPLSLTFFVLATTCAIPRILTVLWQTQCQKCLYNRRYKHYHPTICS